MDKNMLDRLVTSEKRLKEVKPVINEITELSLELNLLKFQWKN